MKSPPMCCHVEIKPSKKVDLGISELLRFHELIFFLAWRDIKIRYKQAILGFGWVIAQPLLTMVVFSVVFGRFAGLPSDDTPYPLFTFVAILPWNLFASTLGKVSDSIVGSAALLRKVYYPQLVTPLSATLASLFDFLVSLFVLAGLMIYYHDHIHIGTGIIYLPLFIALAIVTALAFGLWLSALNVKYRDVKHIVPFLLQAWMFLSPVAYSANLVPEGPWRLVYGLNPMAGVIQGFRWALLRGPRPDDLLVVSFFAVFVILVSGILYFRKTERFFADII